VQHHLFDCDGVETVRAELVDVLDNATLQFDIAVGDQEPHQRRNDRLRRREEREPVVVRRGAERLEREQCTVARNRELTRRRRAVVDQRLRRTQQFVDAQGTISG
jgi:hypothetical protein